MYELANKVILITGAANGIGAAVVNRFLLEGVKHITFIDIDEESGSCLEVKLRREYGEEKIQFIKCDVTKEDQLFGAFNSVVDQHGYIDVVVNNAGLADESTMDQIRKEIEVNYHITFIDIDEESGSRLEEKLRRQYGEEKIKFIKCDVTKEDQLFKAFNSVVDQHVYIDVVVNNAGLADESTMDRIRKQIEVNYIALVQSTFKAVEIMRSDNGGKGGTIINISSVASLRQLSPVVFVYMGTKSAVMQFSNCIGKQEYYSRTGVRVITICFGATETDILNKIRSFDERINEHLQEIIHGNVPMQGIESAALGLVEVYKHGKSGGTWLIANNKPALDVTENVTKAYDIMSEPLNKSS